MPPVRGWIERSINGREAEIGIPDAAKSAVFFFFTNKISAFLFSWGA